MFKITNALGSVSILIAADDPRDAATRLAMLIGIKLKSVNETVRPIVALYDSGARVTIYHWYL